MSNLATIVNNILADSGIDDISVVIGSGTSGYIPVFTSTGRTIGNSILNQSGGNLLIGGNIALHAGNFNSYAPTLIGVGASGTWGISITGNADTVDGYHMNQNLLTSSSPTFAGLTSNGSIFVNGVGVFTSSSDHQISLRSPDAWTGIEFDDSQSGFDYIWFNGIYQTFAIGGGGASVLGKKLHIDGGTTIGSNYDSTSVPLNGLNVEGAIQQAGNQVLHAGNFNSYAPTLTGGGASGTWGINITGSAGSAGSATTASYVDGTSGGAIRAWDIRTISPSSMSANRLGFGFTSWANNNTSPYADYLHLRSYGDGSGGADNLVMFLKSGIGMRIYQQSFGSSTPYSTFKDVAWTDGTNSSGTWPISISGNAATASNSTQWAGYSLPSWTNWSSRGGIDITVGSLGWKNYGNSHVIFDASNGTSPNGVGVNNTNSQVAWTATYPTLMGWNGANTYGVRVDSARTSDQLGGYSSSSYVGQFGNSYYQVNTWLQMNGTHGIYWPSYYGLHISPNTTTTYTQLRIDGNKNGYGGIWDSYSYVNGIMYDGNGNGGVYRESPGVWYWYYYRPNDCMGIGTSSTDSAYSLYLNKGVFAQSVIQAPSFRISPYTGYYRYGTYSGYMTSMAYLSFDWDASYNQYQNHGIASTSRYGGFSDSMSINSFNDINLRIDTNDNDASSYVRFHHHTTGDNQFAYIGYNNDIGQFQMFLAGMYCTNSSGYCYNDGYTSANYGSGAYSASCDFCQYWSLTSCGLYSTNYGSWYNINPGYPTFAPSNGECMVYDGWGGGNLYIGGNICQNWYSDCKYKENITEIDSALDKIDAIRGVEFDWNELGEEEAFRKGHEVGVIAQEVQAVYPQAVREVSKEREDHVVTALVVDYEKFTPLLIQSIKELKVKVDNIKSRLDAGGL